MASRYERYVIKANGKKHVVFAVSEKQAWFIFFNAAKARREYMRNPELIEITGVYPGDIISGWNNDTKEFYDFVAR